MTNIEKQNKEIIRYIKELEFKCEMLERDNKSLEREKKNLNINTIRWLKS